MSLSKVFAQTLAIKSHEEVLVLYDSHSREVGEEVAKAVEELSGEVIRMEMKPRQRHGEEPPESVAYAMAHAHVVIAPTTKSISHTEARKKACKAGARVATMPGITMEMLNSGAMLADYGEVKKIAGFFAEKLTHAERVLIKTELGTHLELSVAGRKALADDGDLSKKGAFGNLPAGEAFIAPVEDSAHGRVVFDASLGGFGKLSEPVEVEIERGKAVKGKLLKLLTTEEARVVAEFGIGCNPKARVIGNVLEDEKAFGTVHIAFGSNFSFGGRNKAGIHIDGVINNPDVWLDDEKIMDKGKFLCFP